MESRWRGKTQEGQGEEKMRTEVREERVDGPPVGGDLEVLVTSTSSVGGNWGEVSDGE